MTLASKTTMHDNFENPTVEGMRLARDKVFKQWQKECQRSVDLRKLADERGREIKRLEQIIRLVRVVDLGEGETLWCCSMCGIENPTADNHYQGCLLGPFAPKPKEKTNE